MMTKTKTPIITFTRLSEKLFQIPEITTGKLLFNIVPTKGDDQHIFRDRYVPIELVDSDFNLVGLLIWDIQESRTYGPYLGTPDLVIDQKGSTPDVLDLSAHGYLVLEGYKWEYRSKYGTEIFLYFVDKSQFGTIDFCVTGIQSGNPKLEEC